MKMYPDLTVEGTPEEVAAFKHIDAALAGRNKRSQLAIEAAKPKTNGAHPVKAKSKRKRKTPHYPGAEYRARVRKWAQQHEDELGFKVGDKGIVAQAAITAYEKAHAHTEVTA